MSSANSWYWNYPKWLALPDADHKPGDRHTRGTPVEAEMSDFPPVIYVDLFQGRSLLRRPQKWRWRALNAGNGRVLAVSSESYTNRQDCVDAITQLFGPATTVYRREPEQGNLLLRAAQ